MASERFRPVRDVPQLHEVPRVSVRVEPGKVVVECDASDESRIRITFRTRQAIRITTSDCVVRPDDGSYAFRRLIEDAESAWIGDLRQALTANDEYATFLDDAHHYLIDAGDDVIEVVAWSVTWEVAEE